MTGHDKPSMLGLEPQPEPVVEVLNAEPDAWQRLPWVRVAGGAPRVVLVVTSDRHGYAVPRDRIRGAEADGYTLLGERTIAGDLGRAQLVRCFDTLAEARAEHDRVAGVGGHPAPPWAWLSYLEWHPGDETAAEGT